MAGALIVRADAGSDIGLGHVMRTLAIAQAWQDAGGRVVYAMNHGDDAVRSRLARERIDIARVGNAVRETVALAERERAAVLVDGYELDDDVQSACVDAGLVCAVVDDHARLPSYSAHVVIDPNVGAEASRYRTVTPGARVLAGLSYALLRREFERDRRTSAARSSNVVVTFGGADAARITERTLEVLDARLDVTVLVGSANPRMAEIERAASRFAAARVVRDAVDVASILAGADVAISAAGTTCSELAYLGVPAVVVAVADNQMPVARGFAALGTVRFAGDVHVESGTLALAVSELLEDEAARSRMHERGIAAVDRRGPSRIVSAMTEGRTC